MVAYSFKPSFVVHIQAGEKRQTIRRERKRHARAGEGLQLFTGSRFHPVRLGSATCLCAPEVRLDFENDIVELDGLPSVEGSDALNAFARRDGFILPERMSMVGGNWQYMKRWWALTHGNIPVFTGRLIYWGETFVKVAQP
jgi:hypothetical protein